MIVVVVVLVVFVFVVVVVVSINESTFLHRGWAKPAPVLAHFLSSGR